MSFIRNEMEGMRRDWESGAARRAKFRREIHLYVCMAAALAISFSIVMFGGRLF